MPERFNPKPFPMRDETRILISNKTRGTENTDDWIVECAPSVLQCDEVELEVRPDGDAEVADVLKSSMAGSGYGDTRKADLQDPEKDHFLRFDLFLEAINERVPTPITRRTFRQAFSFLDFPMMRDPEPTPKLEKHTSPP